MNTDVKVVDAENVVFGDDFAFCTIDHNEDGASIDLEIPCGIIPIAIFTDFRASHSNFLFLSLRDMDVEVSTYEVQADEHAKIRAGKAYFTQVNHREGDEEPTVREIVNLNQSIVYSRDSVEDKEWMDGIIARSICTEY